ncbi:phosphotransferase [Mycobacterium sp. E1747]|uniref:phosphotransferase n=1 Tax=Mycobacterium sp. E1747 TaxID=1834128 RepID=UPI0009EECF63|nr:phosphotransferase [Mycobacterium sp. E1747]
MAKFRVGPHSVPQAAACRLRRRSAEFVVVMEDLAPFVAVDQIVGLSLYQAEAVADNLARLHAWSWESPRLTNEAAVFPALDSPIGRAVNAQLAHLFSMGWSHYRLVVPRIAPEISDFADRFGEFVPILIDRLATPRTLVHGELRSDNLFFAADGEPIIIDFQMALQEAGIRDLAYVVSQSLPVELRRAHEGALVRRYWEGLVSAGVRDYSFARAQHQYRSAVAFGLVYPMVAFTRYETANERGREVLKTMLGRAIEAIEDNQAVETVVSEGSVKFD